jgi:hypothetical protein
LLGEGSEDQVGAIPSEYGGHTREEDPVGQRMAEQGADDRAGNRRRRHPRDHLLVNATRSNVLEAAGGGRGGADCDVRPGRGGRFADQEEDQRQPQCSQDQPDRRAEVAGDERAGER